MNFVTRCAKHDALAAEPAPKSLVARAAGEKGYSCKQTGLMEHSDQPALRGSCARDRGSTPARRPRENVHTKGTRQSCGAAGALRGVFCLAIVAGTTACTPWNLHQAMTNMVKQFSAVQSRSEQFSIV
jgi:hypothetical protein